LTLLGRDGGHNHRRRGLGRPPKHPLRLLGVAALQSYAGIKSNRTQCTTMPCRASEQIEEDLGDTSQEQVGRRRRVREAVAVSVLHFHGCTLQDACRQVARGLERRGISRTPSQLQSFRDELDCKKHKATARANGASAGEAAAQRLEAWSFQPPLKLSPTGSADTTKQQDYDALWPVAEDLVASVITKERRTEIEAAQLVTQRVLDTIAPKQTAARPGPAQQSPWAKPRPDK